jgi:hypothetical protein
MRRCNRLAFGFLNRKLIYIPLIKRKAMSNDIMDKLKTQLESKGYRCEYKASNFGRFKALVEKNDRYLDMEIYPPDIEERQIQLDDVLECLIREVEQSFNEDRILAEREKLQTIFEKYTFPFRIVEEVFRVTKSFEMTIKALEYATRSAIDPIEFADKLK